MYLLTTEADLKEHENFHEPRNKAVQNENGDFRVPRDKANDQNEHGNFMILS